MGNTSKKAAPKAAPKAKKPTKDAAIKEVSFVDQVLAKSKGDNPGNIAMFQERAVRYVNRELQELEDKMIDAWRGNKLADY